MRLNKYEKDTIELAKKYSTLILKRPLLEQTQAERKSVFRAQIKYENPKLKDDMIDKITDFYSSYFNQLTNSQLDELFIQLILQLYTKEELQALIQFYETDIGSSISNKNAMLMGKMADPFDKIINYGNLHAIDHATSEMNKRGIRFKV